MATVYDVETVLNNRLLEYAQDTETTVGPDDIHWSNIGYEPVVGTPYIAANFVPASSAPVGVGQESPIREIGFYQLSVAVPSGEGKGTVKQIVSELHQYFKQSSTLTYGGINVRVQRFRVFDTFTGPDWFIQIVRVEWRSDIPNNN